MEEGVLKRIEETFTNEHPEISFRNERIIIYRNEI